MKSIALLTAVAAAALCMAAPSGAHLFRPGCNAKLAPKAELRCARHNKQHAQATIAWAKAQQKRIAFYDAAQSLLLHRIIVNHRWLYKTMSARVGEAKRRIYAASFPPHHLLWLCISRGEGGIRSVNPNGHYGMLQMHADWGYGTSHHASDDSQLTQEWAAERAYKASGYSRSFLMQQWAADAHCF